MRIFYLSCFLILTPVLALAQQETSPRPSWAPLLEKARGLASRGSYLEAEEIYESLLTQGELGRREVAVRREYEALRIKIIFSSVETPDSFFYTVAPGDTLHVLAKKYGTTVELLQKSNGLPSRDRIYAGMKLKVTRSHFSILIKKRRNRLILFADGKPLKRYRVATGAKGLTPSGSFKIVNKLENPTWFKAGAIVPPDSPENILGSRWLGFDAPGYGIHGTTLPKTIGTHASKGCVRMLNADVEELYDLIPPGTPVTIRE